MSKFGGTKKSKKNPLSENLSDVNEENEEHRNKRKNPSDDELSADAGDTSEMSKSGGTKKAKKNPLPENPSDNGSE